MKKLLSLSLFFFLLSGFVLAQTTLTVPGEFKKYYSFVIHWNKTEGSTYRIKITHQNGLNTVTVVDESIGSDNYYFAENLPDDNKKYTVEVKRLNGSGVEVETKETEVTTLKVETGSFGTLLHGGIGRFILSNIGDNEIDYWLRDIDPVSEDHVQHEVHFVITSEDFRTEYYRFDRIPIATIDGFNFVSFDVNSTFIKMDREGVNLSPRGTYRIIGYALGVVEVGLFNNHKTYYSDIGTEVFTLDDAAAPTDLAANNISFTKARLSWDYDGVPNFLTGVQIESNPNPFIIGNQWTTTGFTIDQLPLSAEFARISGLSPGSTYYFRVKSEYDETEVSAYASDYVTFSTPDLPVLTIDFPTLVAERVTDRVDFNLAWPSVLEIELDAIEVLIDPVGESNPTGTTAAMTFDQLTGNSLSETMLGLSAGTNYQLNVVGTFDSGEQFNLLNTSYSTPAVNPSFTVGTETDITDRSFRINIEDFHPLVSSFRIDVYENSTIGCPPGNPGCQVIDDLVLYSPTYKIQGLSSNTTYTYEVSAFYPDATFVTAAQTPTVSTNSPLPDPATITHPIMGPLGPSGLAPASIEINWIGNDANLDHFFLAPSADFGGGCTADEIEAGLEGLAGTNVGLSTSFTQTALFDLDALSYQYIIQSYNNTGQFSPSEPINLANCACYDPMSVINERMSTREIIREVDGSNVTFYLSGVDEDEIEANYFYQWEVPDEWDIVSYENYQIRVDDDVSPSTNFVTVNVLNPCSQEVSDTKVYSIDGSANNIIFDEIPDLDVSSNTYELQAASAASNITFSSSNTSVATVSANTLTIVGQGTTTITANDNGNASLPMADPISQTITIGKATQTINVDPVSTKTFGDAPFALSFTGGASGESVVFTSLNEDVITVSGSTVTIAGAGNGSIMASQAGNSDFEAAEEVVFEIMVERAAQTISFDPVASPLSYGAGPVILSATSTSGLEIDFSADDPDVAVVVENTLYINSTGSVTISAAQIGDDNYTTATPVSQMITVEKADQTITFDEIADQVEGAVLTLSASASSGLTVTYGVAGPASLVGEDLTLNGPGMVTVTASQSGDDNFNAANDVIRSFNVTEDKEAQTITFTSLPAKVFGDAPFELTGVASSGLGVSYSVSDGSVATISGTTVTVVGAGTTMITASQSGNEDYFPATDVIQMLTVLKADQSVTFELGANAMKTFGDPNFNLSATATSGLDVTFESSDPSVASVDYESGEVSIHAAGTTTLTVGQPGGDNFNAAVSVEQTLTVEKALPTITFNPVSIPDQSLTTGSISLDITTPNSFAIAASIKSGPGMIANTGPEVYEVTFTGSGIIVIEASVSGDDDYHPATAELSFNVIDDTKQNQTIAFSSIPDKTFGDDPFTLSATSSSGLALTYTSTNSSVATISGNEVTVTGAGSTTITASQQGDETFNPATSVEQTLTVLKANQSLTFDLGSDAIKTFGDPNFSLSASSSSGLALSYESSNPGVASVDDESGVVSIHAAGTTTLKVSQSGNDNFNATEVEQILTVNKAIQIILFTPSSLADQPLSAGSVSLEIVSNIGSAIEAVIVSGPATIAGTGPDTYEVTFTGEGEVAVQGSTEETTDYLAASQELTFTIVDDSKTAQTINFAALDAKTFGDAPFQLSASSSSGLEIAYVSSDESVATISGNQVTIVGAGSTVVTAQQGGNEEFLAAPDVSQTLLVNKADQLITIENIEDRGIEDPPFEVVAETNSGLAIEFSVAGPASISGQTITLDGVIGTVTVTASQTGNDNYNEAQEQTSFEVLEVALGLEDEEVIKLYPNPVQNHLNIQSDHPVDIRIFSLSGTLVLDREKVSGSIDLTTLKPGIYMLELTHDGTKANSRIVKAN